MRVSVSNGDGGVFTTRADASAFLLSASGEDSVLSAVDFSRDAVVLAAVGDTCGLSDDLRLIDTRRVGDDVELHYVNNWRPGRACPGLAPYEIHAVVAPSDAVRGAVRVEVNVELRSA